MADTHELPLFPTSAPEILADTRAARALFGPVLADLAAIVDVDEDQLDLPTPCQDYDVATLRHHVLGWLQFFAAALHDPAGSTERIDPESWDLAEGERASDVVRRAAADIERAIDAGVASELVAMSQARMAGDGVLAMALGEYLIHGWDLAVSTGQRWSPADAAVEPALTFLQGTVEPEHRGRDGGFFGEEVEPPADATPLERLLCFAGRHPRLAPAG